MVIGMEWRKASNAMQAWRFFKGRAHPGRARRVRRGLEGNNYMMLYQRNRQLSGEIMCHQYTVGEC